MYKTSIKIIELCRYRTCKSTSDLNKKVDNMLPKTC